MNKQRYKEIHDAGILKVQVNIENAETKRTRCIMNVNNLESNHIEQIATLIINIC